MTVHHYYYLFFCVCCRLYCSYDMCVCDVCRFLSREVDWVGVWVGLGWWEFVVFDFRMNICTVQFYICDLKMYSKNLGQKKVTI